jgi:glucosamine-6-phosphate deaminase
MCIRDSYCTSGFTAVTNNYLKSVLMAASAFISNGAMKEAGEAYELFISNRGYHDITGYLNGIANQNKETQLFNLATRMVRRMIEYTSSKAYAGISDFIQQVSTLIAALEPGSREPEVIHLVKGWIREFEAELAWAHFGIGSEYVHHLRLKFYSDDIFPDYPDYEQDVMPLFRMMMEISPDIITMAIDPEGSGPDTHYKSLMAISAATDEYIRVTGRKDIRLWGYRNVWSRFDPQEVSTIIPVSLNSLAVLHNMFNSCFLSQRSASFPSYEFEGTFSELAQKIWVEQFNHLRTILGDDFFYKTSNRMLNRAYGAILLKDMNYEEFTQYLVPLRRLLQSKELLGK